MFEAVINPAGAGGAAMQTWQKTKDLLEQYHLPYREHFSKKEYGIRELVSELTAEGETDLLIIGGDGSMNEAVNGICSFEKTRLAFIPSGSGNDLAKALNIPSDPEILVRILLDNQVKRHINIGRVTFLNRFDGNGRPAEGGFSRLFNISSGIGFDAAICEEVQRSAAKKVLNQIHLGKLIYLYVAVHQIFTAKRTAARITLDHKETFTYPSLLLTVGMNTAFEGGGFRFAPDADPGDSLLDFCIADNLSQWDFFRIFPYAYSGAHTKFKGIYIKRGRTAEIETDEPVWVHTDGEIDWQSTHIILELLDEKLRMMI